MGKQLLVATRNEGKVREIKTLLQPFGVDVSSLNDYDSMPDIVEDGITFAQNAAKKALTIARYTNQFVMGEDSGLEVDALNGAPGVYSARFAGEHADDESNNDYLLKKLLSVSDEQRTARYQCCIVLATPEKVLDTIQCSCEGLISHNRRGTNGFGYDSLFIVPQYGQTFGELDPAIKSDISHRAQAMKKFIELLPKYLPLIQ